MALITLYDFLSSAINIAKGVLRYIEHVEHSSSFIGMQNLDCAFLSSGISNTSIPPDVTIITISHFDLNADGMAIQINVLLVPP